MDVTAVWQCEVATPRVFPEMWGIDVVCNSPAHPLALHAVTQQHGGMLYGACGGIYVCMHHDRSCLPLLHRPAGHRAFSYTINDSELHSNPPPPLLHLSPMLFSFHYLFSHHFSLRRFYLCAGSSNPWSHTEGQTKHEKIIIFNFPQEFETFWIIYRDTFLI